MKIHSDLYRAFREDIVKHIRDVILINYPNLCKKIKKYPYPILSRQWWNIRIASQDDDVDTDGNENSAEYVGLTIYGMHSNCEWEIDRIRYGYFPDKFTGFDEITGRNLAVILEGLRVLLQENDTENIIYSPYKDFANEIENEVSTLLERFVKRKKEHEHLAKLLYKDVKENLSISKATLRKTKTINLTSNSTDNTPKQNQSIPKFLNVIYQNDQIIGREEDYEKLQQLMSVSKRIVLVNGLGGVGKTTFAKYYLQLNKHLYKHVAWISIAETTTGNEENFASAFVDDHVLVEQGLGLHFADEKIITEDEEIIKKRYRTIIHALQNLPGPNLLVLDNVDAYINQYRDTLPIPPDWDILLTSRMNIQGFESFPLDNLTEENSLKLFKKWHSKIDDTQEVINLLKTVGYHTLMVELLAKTLTASLGGITLIDLVEKLKSNNLNHELLQDRISTDHTKEESTLLTHLLTTFRFVNLKDEELYVLRCFYFLPTEFYKAKILIEWFDPLNKQEFKNALKTLFKKGWLQFADGKFQMHRLIQVVVYYALSPGIEIVQTFIEKLNHNRIEGNMISNGISEIPIIAFLISQLFTKNDYNFELGLLCSNLASLYKEYGQYRNAVSSYDRAIAIFTKLEHIDDRRIPYMLATCYYTQSIIADKYKSIDELSEFKNKAVDVLYNLSEDYKNKDFGDEQLFLITIGMFYEEKNQLNDAKNTYFEFLEHSRRLYLIDEFENLLQFLNAHRFVASFFLTHNQLLEAKIIIDQAEDLIRQKGEIGDSHLGEEVASLLSMSGKISYEVNNDLEKAISSYDESIRMFENLCKKDYKMYEYKIANLRIEYGNILFLAQQFELSEEQFKKAEVVYSKIVEQDKAVHIFPYAKLLGQLARTLTVQGKDGLIYFDKAQKLIDELIAQGLVLHELYYFNNNFIGLHYLSIGDHNSAVEYLTKSRTFYQIHINEGNYKSHLVVVAQKLAICYSMLKHYKLMGDNLIDQYIWSKELFDEGKLDKDQVLISAHMLLSSCFELGGQDRSLEMEKWSLIIVHCLNVLNPQEESYISYTNGIAIRHGINFTEWFNKEVAPHI